MLVSIVAGGQQVADTNFLCFSHHRLFSVLFIKICLFLEEKKEETERERKRARDKSERERGGGRRRE